MGEDLTLFAGQQVAHGDTVKKLEEKMTKELQALTASLKKKTETTGGVDEKTVDKMAHENDKKISELEYKVRDAVNRKDLESFIETKANKTEAERKASDDAHNRQYEELKKQHDAQNKHVQDEVKQQEARAKQMEADIMKEVNARIAETQKLSDTTKLEARLKVLEAQLVAMGKG